MIDRVQIVKISFLDSPLKAITTRHNRRISRTSLVTVATFVVVRHIEVAEAQKVAKFVNHNSTVCSK